MGKFELSLNNDEEIIKAIQNIILSKHPIIENRIDILFNYPSPVMDIILNFYSDKNNDKFTQILFCDGNENMRCGISEQLFINDYISIDVLCNLIHYILSDHDHIKSISKENDLIKLVFGVDVKNENIKGISCGDINLQLDFKKLDEHNKVSDYYLREIVNCFYDQLKYTDSFRREYNEYCLLLKEKFVNSLTDRELYDFIEMLDSNDLHSLLLNMCNERFIELYDDFKRKNTIGKHLIK